MRAAAGGRPDGAGLGAGDAAGGYCRDGWFGGRSNR